MHAAALLTPGWSAPLGATTMADGVNLSLHAPAATAVELCLFDTPQSTAPSQVHSLDRATHRTGSDRHSCRQGIGAGQLCGWRIDPPSRPAEGLGCDPANLLLDPAPWPW